MKNLLFLVAILSLAHCSTNRPPMETDTRLVKIGEIFTVTKTSQLGTGYRWKLAQPIHEAYLELVSTQVEETTQEVDGGQNQESWQFKAIGKGSTTLEWVYQPAWEKNLDKKAKTYSIRVQID